MVKKLNALVSLICCLCLFGHCGTMTYSMMTGWYSFAICKNLAHATAITVGVHVALVLVIFFFLQDQSNMSRYKKENGRVMAQRASGLIMIIVLHAHVKNYGFIMSGEPFLAGDKAKVIILEFIFFLSVFMHLSSSFSKAFVSLGLISSKKTLTIVDRVMQVLCIVLFLVVMVTMVRFVVGFTGHV